MHIRAAAVSTALLFIAAPAIAGGLVEPETETQPVAAVPAVVAGGFAGWYGALDLGRAAGGGIENPGTGWTDIELEDGNCYGGTLGRNAQRGQLVYGAELRHMRCTDLSGLLGQKPFNSVTDLRLRVGAELGQKAMVYGAVGYSWVGFEAPFGDQTVAGPSVGLGLEVNATDRIFAGVDYTTRAVTGNGGETDFDFDVSTTSVRLGLRF